MTIRHRIGKSNTCADFLSRFVDNFPDEFIHGRAFVNTVAVSRIPTIAEIKNTLLNEPPPNGQNMMLKDGLAFYIAKIWILPYKFLLSKHADSFYHPGVIRTLTAIRKVFS